MLDSIKFVQGGIDKSAKTVEMSHFSISNGRIVSKNSCITISSPIPLDIKCSPNASDFVEAISECEGTISMTMTKAGKLSIKSGGYKALIKCADIEKDVSFPEGDIYPLDGITLIKALSVVIKFVSQESNPSRIWTRGVLFKGSSLFATNGACLVEYYVGQAFNFVCNIPYKTVKELIRIKDKPDRIQVSPHAVTFHYPNGRWLKSQLYEANWPDISKLINVESKQTPINESIFKGIKKIKHFSDIVQSIYFHNGLISTANDINDGTTFDVEGLVGGSIFDADIFLLLDGIAKTIDLTQYPRPCSFTGDIKEHPIRGVIVGKKL